MPHESLEAQTAKSYRGVCYLHRTRASEQHKITPHHSGVTNSCARSSPPSFATSAIASAQVSAPVQGKEGITLPTPPVVQKQPVTDTYQVANSAPVTITDDYRWLEDQQSPATRAFIADQNAYTQKYLDQVKILPEVRTQMASLLKVDQISEPSHRGNRYFYSKRLADENQGSIYMREGLHGPDIRLIDGTRMSADGNTSVNFQGISKDGSVLIYGVRVGRSPTEAEIHFFDVASRKDRADILPSARYSGVSFAPDMQGVYYSRYYPHDGARVFYHAFGAAPGTEDTMLLGHSYNNEPLGEIDYIGCGVSENGHWLILSIDRGVPAKRVDILVKDLRVKDSPLTPLVYGYDSRFSDLLVGDTFYLDTDFNAPNHRIVKAEFGVKPEQWKTVIPEGKDVLESVNVVSNKFFVLRLHDVKSGTLHLRARRQKDRRDRLPRRRDRFQPFRPRRRYRRLLRLPIHHHAAHHLPLRHAHRQKRHLRRRKSPLRLKPSTSSSRSFTPPEMALVSPCSSPGKRASSATAPSAC